MAILNLLQAKYTGKLGETSGSTWKGKPVIKASPFSKAPPTALQTQNVRAFEALNRISATIAKMNFKMLGLPSKNRLPHNAVAHFLKPAIRQHIFVPHNISEVIVNDGVLNIYSMTYSSSDKRVNLQAAFSTGYVPAPDAIGYLLFFNQYGTVFYSRVFDTPIARLSFYLDRDPAFIYYAMAFIAETINGKRILHGFTLKGDWNMQYSFNEQITGDVWLDNKPIFMRSWSIQWHTLSGGTNAQVLLAASGLERLIKCEYSTHVGANFDLTTSDEIAFSINGQFAFLNTYLSDALGGIVVSLFPQNDVLAAALSNQTTVITIFYTKAV